MSDKFSLERDEPADSQTYGAVICRGSPMPLPKRVMSPDWQVDSSFGAGFVDLPPDLATNADGQLIIVTQMA